MPGTVSSERFPVDFELGYGGGTHMTGSAMLVMRATLAGPYSDWKKEMILKHKDLYPGSCKAFGCQIDGAEGSDGGLVWCVLFHGSEMTNVQGSHDVSKPSIMRDMIDDGIIKEVTSLEWHVVSKANDYDNIGGPKQEVLCVGRILDPLTSKIAAAMESLNRTQETFEGSCRFLVEAEFEGQVAALTAGMNQMAKKHMRVHIQGPLVIVDGQYLGSIREFEKYVANMYRYKDSTPDGMYVKRAAKALASYMQQKEGSSEFCYLDLHDSAGDVLIKPRVIFELYKGLAPKTVENFLALCEDGYAGSAVHRVVKKGWLQFGAIGDKSIWGGTFEDETFGVRHGGPGDLGMANSGPHSNASQFYVSLDKLDWLDGKKVVFGRVVDGLKAIRHVSRCDLHEWNQRPVTPFTIASSGKLRFMDLLAPQPRVAPKRRDDGEAETLAIEHDAESRKEGAAPGAGGEEPAEVLQSLNDFDDAAVAAALKIQTIGRGLRDRKRAKMIKQETFKSDVLAVAADVVWAVLSDFRALYLVNAAIADKVEVTFEGNLEKKGQGATRNFTTGGGPPVEHTLISNNMDKMIMSLAESGSRDHLSAAPVADATYTWKIKAEVEGCVASLTVKYLEKEGMEAEVPAYLKSVKKMLDAAADYAVNPPPPPVEAEAAPAAE